MSISGLYLVARILRQRGENANNNRGVFAQNFLSATNSLRWQQEASFRTLLAFRSLTLLKR